ncbi:hypothetical protein DOTSEDRAFT_39127 [Dothistroma septosporum NZE10]|uniref:Uncharacterized protein n=1 Tax=Dothistroma septosporum (strain NZE10 / CBS 128990) TaxID=675120 RepID=M2YJ42_DOTSN|nr:hypothetical protein DOTSEDRAFT_39127 [Dothistroma septosporum NZE10]
MQSIKDRLFSVKASETKLKVPPGVPTSPPGTDPTKTRKIEAQYLPNISILQYASDSGLFGEQARKSMLEEDSSLYRRSLSLNFAFGLTALVRRLFMSAKGHHGSTPTTADVCTERKMINALNTPPGLLLLAVPTSNENRKK